MDHTTAPGDSAAPPQPPWSTVLWAHHGKCSAGGRSSPGPADGPELQPVPSGAAPGRRTPASLWGTGQHHPRHPGGKGVPIPSSHFTWAWQRLWVLGASGCAGSSPVLCHSSQEQRALHSTPWPLASPQRGRGTAGGRNKVLSVAAATSLALKNKILSSLFLQVFPSCSR